MIINLLICHLKFNNRLSCHVFKKAIYTHEKKINGKEKGFLRFTLDRFVK
jgi:hypothetical protein